MKKLLCALIVSLALVASLGGGAPAAAADAVEIVNVDYPHVVEPGNVVNFKVTVKINSGQLLESRGDMLRNTDGHLFGHWPHIGVKGAHNAGESYRFESYGTMVAPSAEGTYESKWRVWQNAAYVGGEATISFQVKKGSGGGEPPPYVKQYYTEVSPCQPDSATPGYVDYGGRHYYIDLVITKGTPIKDSELPRQHPRAESDNLWLTLAIAKEGPLDVQEPGTQTAPGNIVPSNTWRVFIFDTFLLVNPGVIRSEFDHNPGSLVHLTCTYQRETLASKIFYTLHQFSISASKVGDRIRQTFVVPSWMKSIFVIQRKNSDATIALRSPDGTLYNASHPQVEYFNTPQYAMLKLNQSIPGEWEALIDVTAVEPDSVFLLSIGGTYGTPTNPDFLAPFTNITVEATRGNNSWLVSNARIALSADDMGGSGVSKIEWSVDGGVSWNQYSAPVIIIQEGLTVFMARATDNAGNVEILPPTKYLRIDKTAPVVNVSTDKPQYTRIDPFVVHYTCSDPEPGSGVISCTAVFNGQPVQNGQTLDLFWLNLGTYSVDAKGGDYAGWVTNKSASFQVIATVESLQGTVNRLCKENYITNSGICNSLRQKLDAALAARNRGQNNAAVNQLQALQNEVKAQAGKAIQQKAVDLLLMDSTYVIKVLSAK